MQRQPNEGHHRLMQELHRVCDVAEGNGIPKIEQIALLAQLIGQHIHHLPPSAGYTAPDIMEAVARNMHVGNQTASGAGLLATVVGHG